MSTNINTEDAIVLGSDTEEEAETENEDFLESAPEVVPAQRDIGVEELIIEEQHEIQPIVIPDALANAFEVAGREIPDVVTQEDQEEEGEQVEEAAQLPSQPQRIPQLAQQNSSSDVFQTPIIPQKRQRENTPPSQDESNGDRKVEEEEEEGNLCSICFEPLASNGAHRMVSIKCGHIFGMQCIKKWFLRSKKDKISRCPECNTPGKTRDIRVIYAKKVIATDTTEKEELLEELKREKIARQSAEIEHANMNLALQMIRNELVKKNDMIERLRNDNVALYEEVTKYKRLLALQNIPMAADSNRSSTPSVIEKFYPRETITISNQPNAARVMAFNSNDEMLIVSKSWGANQAFTHHGIVKISLHDSAHQEFLPVHSKPVRDVQFNPHGEKHVLTTGLDRTLKISSLVGNMAIQVYSLEAPGWSCCWDIDRPYYLFAGLANGSVMTFDIRNTRTHVSCFRDRGLIGGSPVHSLVYISQPGESGLRGLLGANTENTFMLCDPTETNSQPQETKQCTVFDIKKPGTSFYSVSYDPISSKILASLRSIPQCATTHVLSALANNGTNPTLNQGITIDRWQSRQAHLARTHIFSRWDEENRFRTYVCAGDEASGSLLLWDEQGTTEELSLGAQQTRVNVIDVKRCVLGPNVDILAALTDNQLHVYKWDSK
ncbi:uncharacterized protein VTP21DRAFT_233 [Calcarisporiella thermophila]|uniref:uncharacterized protein n=1 Tax=Calcarisporiella thermophila TaxID=911321 RepID=UPI0037428BBC